MTFYPHLEYSYLLHVDEWFHVSQAKQVVFESDISWYSSEQFNLGMERTWHTMLASIYLIFRPSIPQWIYLPTILHVLSIISVYYFVSKLYNKKNAFISSLLVAIIPSNVTIGGPVFLVPINLCLIFIPIALLFAFRLVKMKKLYNYVILLIITTFLLYSHPPTAITLLLILGFYFILNIFSKKDECKLKAKILFITILSSIILSLPNYMLEIQKKGMESITFNFWIFLQGIPIIYGIMPTIFFIIGLYFLARTDKKETWSIILASLVLIINVLIFTLSGLNYILPYQRTYIPLFLLMSIIASRGYTKLLNIKYLNKKIGVFLIIISLLATTSVAVFQNINTKYYYVIDDDDYENFLWIKENTAINVTILSDPWKARALAPVAERIVYSVTPFGPVEKELTRVEKAYDFLNNNCTNTTFLIQNNISVVYTTDSCENEDLIQMRENIYFLK